MRRRRVAAVFALAAVAALVMAPAGAVTVGQPQVENTTDGTDAGFGTQVSSFMQASAADADTSVEAGLWAASVNASANDTAERRVTARVSSLEDRLAAVERQAERLAALRNDTSNGTVPAVAYNARATALQARIAALQTAVEQVNRTAERVGADPAGLADLKRRAANATGPPASPAALAVTDVGPPADAGPPDEAGPPGDRGASGGDAGPDNRTAGDGESGNAEGDGGAPDEAGPPDDRGQGGQDGGPPDEAGQSGTRDTE